MDAFATLRLPTFAVPKGRAETSNESTGQAAVQPQVFDEALLLQVCGRKRRSRERDYKPRSRFSIVVFNPRAMTCSVIIPTSRLPSSMSDMCPLFISRLTAMSVCVQPFLVRYARMRFPNWTRRA